MSHYSLALQACIEWPEFSKKFNAFKNNVILVIYCVPLFILIPVIIGYLEASGQGVFLRFTPAYVDNYKPAVLCYVVVTNALAAIMDTIVLQRYMALKAKPFGWVPENPKIANIDRCYMYGVYVKILILFVVDIALIIVAAESLPSFDSSVTVELIRLRAVANLEFGLGFDRQSAKKHRDIKAHRQNELNDKQMNDADVAPREMKTAALYND
ncbi:hypothetical protein ROZALSC1DRAFT_29796 [Rozella allomycis CSF55]|uniref:Uncharacterized protein n=1 Tax=Rozella allomycis (strain CSF55) TaxID=988480 RepID=A0A075B2W8_ROZAC|nr:hypothetical protein O9G_005522 [Rozella allomycis CSF55]RKP18534.1 hypothetical protein ROZALSC1DRAFT_29796 [Rozella allomycis CSF55]|eukprot:EPZ36684.1 hypothetical protein O9G_005522 [Rozella allomycis CSF55]